MDPVWNRDAFEGSITRLCFSSTPYDVGWDGDPKHNIDGAVLRADGQMRRLLEREVALRPVPFWARKVAGQIKDMPPCGWCFPQFVEATCTNIGAAEPAAVAPCGCYHVGPQRLGLMANYALCLDAWLKAVEPAAAAAELGQRARFGRDWLRIARGLRDALGERNRPKVLLVRRLLGRLRFWLRAPLGHMKADDNPRLGYLYTHAMGRYGGWDYFSFERQDPEVVDLEGQIRDAVGPAKRWLELIDCTWPCAPKAFRYLERLIVAIGRMTQAGEDAPPPLDAPLAGGILQVEGTFLDSPRSRALSATAVQALSRYVSDDAFPADAEGGELDADWDARLGELLGEGAPAKVWLAALLLKRITLFKESFKSFHFTRNAEQIV